MFGWLKRLIGGEPPASPGASGMGGTAVAEPPELEVPTQIPAPLPDVSAPPPELAMPASAVPAHQPAPADPALALLCREEILDRDQNAVGQAFELREDMAGRVRASGRRARDFMNELLVDQIDRYGRGAALRSRQVCLRVWDGFLGNSALERLKGLNATLLVQPELAMRAASAETVDNARRLREAGLRIALDHAEPGAWLESMLPVADAAVFRMGFCAPEEISLFTRGVQRLKPGVQVWAWEVGTQDDFELARSVGCMTFSGGFVTRREDWKGNSLSPHGLRLASLLNRLRSGVETREIAEILKHDLALAYRLLRYVNAAAWGLNHRITSVEQAIVLLGQQPLERWVSMMLMGSHHAPGEAVVMEEALVRARFLELVGALRGAHDPAAQLFVLGLFSMLDVALQMPLEDAIKPLKLSEAMQDALLHHRGPMAPYLELVLAFERGDAERVQSFAQVLGVDAGELNRLQFEALDWVQAAES
jgi:c-di-GMP phosphodiesterase